jgi:hypothetical protein
MIVHDLAGLAVVVDAPPHSPSLLASAGLDQGPRHRSEGDALLVVTRLAGSFYRAAARSGIVTEMAAGRVVAVEGAVHAPSVPVILSETLRR